MRGVTKPVELPFVPKRGEPDKEGKLLIGIVARTRLNRLDFGIGADWRHTVIPNFQGNEVAVEIGLWTRRCISATS